MKPERIQRVIGDAVKATAKKLRGVLHWIVKAAKSLFVWGNSDS